MTFALSMLRVKGRASKGAGMWRASNRTAPVSRGRQIYHVVPYVMTSTATLVIAVLCAESNLWGSLLATQATNVSVRSGDRGPSTTFVCECRCARLAPDGDYERSPIPDRHSHTLDG
jgi:hypothetical protein